MSAARSSSRPEALVVIQEQIAAGVTATKCHRCGCFQQTVEALAATEPGKAHLGQALDQARAIFEPKKYDCLGCEVCYPAIAANAFTAAFSELGAAIDLCPTEAPAKREGWPPLSGDYRALRYGAPVAVCTLNSSELVPALADSDVIAIVGTMHTENLGIERLVQNVVTNPNIRRLVLCGEDTRRSVGHLAGQSLESLVANGVDESGRIVGARGKRPVLKNVPRDIVDTFRRQIELVLLIGETDPGRILAEVARAATTAPGPFDGSVSPSAVPRFEARAPKRLMPDPAGYFVVYPDVRAGRIQVEHFTNDGVLTCVIDGETPAALYAEVIARGKITRLDHAAYLGRELARAEHALVSGDRYVQDRAAGEVEPSSCGCSSPCGSGVAR